MHPTPNPAVSVILPVYNANATLSSAVQSILQQTIIDQLELIVIDDGSTDGCTDLLPQHRCLKLVHLPRTGLTGALNHGLSLAQGTYIARMDADDYSMPDRMEKQLNWLTQNPNTGLVSCLVRHGGDPETQGGYARHISWCNRLVLADEIAQNRFIDSPLPHPSVMFRHTLIAQHGNYQEGPFPEDYDLWLRWFEAGVTMEKVPEILLQWNDLPTRLSRTDTRYSDQAFYTHKAKYLARWLKAYGHDQVTIWGAGRLARQRVAHLSIQGISIEQYIDIAPGKIGKRIEDIPVIGHLEIPPPGAIFIVSYVANRGAREKIISFLQEAGYQLGQDFICAS